MEEVETHCATILQTLQATCQAGFWTVCLKTILALSAHDRVYLADANSGCMSCSSAAKSVAPAYFL